MYVYVCIYTILVCPPRVYTSLQSIFYIPTFGKHRALRVGPPLQVPAAPGAAVQVGLDGIRNFRVTTLQYLSFKWTSWDTIVIHSHTMWIMGYTEGYTSHYSDTTLQVIPNNGISLGYHFPI